MQDAEQSSSFHRTEGTEVRTDMILPPNLYRNMNANSILKNRATRHALRAKWYIPGAAATADRRVPVFSRGPRRSPCLPASRRATLRQRDQINFHAEIARQPRHFHRGARRWILRKIARIHFVHRGEVVHVLQEHAQPHRAIQRGPCRLHDGLQILHDAFRLLRRVAGQRVTRGRVKRSLPRNKYESVGFDCLRVRADGLWSFFGENHFPHNPSLRLKMEKRAWKSTSSRAKSFAPACRPSRLSIFSFPFSLFHFRFSTFPPRNVRETPAAFPCCTTTRETAQPDSSR